MTLKDMGFNPWFEEQIEASPEAELHIVRVTSVNRGGYLVRNESKELSAELAGKFRYSAQSNTELPCVGDWVAVDYHNSETLAVIHKVLSRKTFLRRKSTSRTVSYQMIAVNIDIAFIVQSCHYDFNIRRLERYLVMANEGNIAPYIILSKIDLISSDELEEKINEIRDAGITAPILMLSNMTGNGVDEFRELLSPGKTYCLIGSSGVGKTSLINKVLGRDEYETKSVSESGEGTHSTSRRQLIFLDEGAMIIDTPGMRELGLINTSDVMSENFSDIHDLALNCRFSNCSHTQEPGCAILISLEKKDLTEERYRSYLKLSKESDYHTMNYIEKKQKDKSFGQYKKSVLKHKKDRELSP